MVGSVSSGGVIIILEVVKWEEIKLVAGNVVVEWEEVTLKVGDVVVGQEGTILDLGDVPKVCDWPFAVSACGNEVVPRSTDEVGPTSKDKCMNVINMYKLLKMVLIEHYNANDWNRKWLVAYKISMCN